MCLTPIIAINRTAVLMSTSASSCFINGIQYRPIEAYSRCVNILRDYRTITYLCMEEKSHICLCDANVLHDFLDRFYIVVRGSKVSLFCLYDCGKCDDCRSQLKSELERRMLLEARDYPFMYFMTLTYDDKHLPKQGVTRKHLVGFFKRFRIAIQRYIDPFLSFRAFYVGEYGSKRQRPHYHAVLFFSRHLTYFEQLKLHNIFTHNAYYRDEFPCARNVWPYGFRRQLDFCKNPVASARYCTKYLVKQFIETEHPEYPNPVFYGTPRRGGGLGASRLDDYRDEMVLSSNYKFNVCGHTVSIRLPKFIIRKLFPSVSSQFDRASLCVETFILLYKYIKKDGVFHNAFLHQESTIVNTMDAAYQIVKYFHCPCLHPRVKKHLQYLEVFLPKLDIGDIFLTCEELANRFIADFPTKEQFMTTALNKIKFYSEDLVDLPSAVYLQSERLAKYGNLLDDILYSPDDTLE